MCEHAWVVPEMPQWYSKCHIWYIKKSGLDAPTPGQFGDLWQSFQSDPKLNSVSAFWGCFEQTGSLSRTEEYSNLQIIIKCTLWQAWNWWNFALVFAVRRRKPDGHGVLFVKYFCFLWYGFGQKSHDPSDKQMSSDHTVLPDKIITCSIMISWDFYLKLQKDDNHKWNPPWS